MRALSVSASGPALGYAVHGADAAAPAAACPRIEIPNLFFKGYWPFWTNAAQGIDFADSLLERLLSQGLAPEEA